MDTVLVKCVDGGVGLGKDLGGIAVQGSKFGRSDAGQGGRSGGGEAPGSISRSTSVSDDPSGSNRTRPALTMRAF
ncbi:MAG: hypothetical protein ABFR89_11265 [Actinomycetota bacterium]